MLAQEKVGSDAEEFLAVRLGRIRSSWLLSGPTDGFVLLLDEVLLPVHVDVKWGKASLRPAFMGGLSPVLYRLIVLARRA